MDTKTKESPQFKQGYLYAVRLLTASKKSAKEVAKRLKDKGYESSVIETVVESLKTQGILNDRKMVDETVQWAKQAKRFGKRRVALELKKKGITQNIIDSALQNYSKEEERKTAYSLAEVRWQKIKNIESQKRKRRLFDFLINRGFDFELSREIINQLDSQKANDDI